MCLITKTRLDSETETLIPTIGGGFDAVAMRESGQGYWMQDDIGGTLRAEGEDRPSRPSHVIAQPVAYNITFCDANGVRSDRPNGGLYVNETDVTSTLTEAGVGTNVVQSISFPWQMGGTIQMPIDKDISGSLIKNQTMAVATAMQVRRLTPVECERLQGFPDGYTNIPWRNKPESPDGPRYKALGNSMAVPVMRWIGERINEVSKL
jgi:hypothetical protein